jgi:hypothetical protein
MNIAEWLARPLCRVERSYDPHPVPHEPWRKERGSAFFESAAAAPTSGGDRGLPLRRGGASAGLRCMSGRHAAPAAAGWPNGLRAAVTVAGDAARKSSRDSESDGEGEDEMFHSADVSSLPELPFVLIHTFLRPPTCAKCYTTVDICPNRAARRVICTIRRKELALRGSPAGKGLARLRKDPGKKLLPAGRLIAKSPLAKSRHHLNNQETPN